MVKFGEQTPIDMSARMDSAQVCVTGEARGAVSTNTNRPEGVSAKPAQTGDSSPKPAAMARPPVHAPMALARLSAARFMAPTSVGASGAKCVSRNWMVEWHLHNLGEKSAIVSGLPFEIFPFFGDARARDRARSALRGMGRSFSSTFCEGFPSLVWSGLASASCGPSYIAGDRWKFTAGTAAGAQSIAQATKVRSKSRS